VLKMMEWKDDDMKDKAEKTKDDNMNGKNTGSIVPYDFGIGDDDGFDLVATPSTATFRAKYMDFKLGEFLQGLEKEVVPLGTTFSAHGVTEGWGAVSQSSAFRASPTNHSLPVKSSAIPTSRNGRYTMGSRVTPGYCNTSS